ncbi:class I SAM-dependent methyltransferase [Hymenobacter daeguensis]
MFKKTLLRKWYHQLPPSVITLIRQLRRVPPVVAEVHTDASWLDNCRNLLAQMGGSSGEVEQGRCQIAWPDAETKTKLRASVRANPSSDLSVFFQVWKEPQYQAVVDYMKPWLKAGDELRIIDAGANVGFATLFFKARFPNAHIISLEPEESNYAQLTSNVAANGMQHVKALKAGLWQRQAQLEVGRDVGDQREWSFYVKETDQPTGLQGYDVQYLMKEAGWDCIDLLKIDIEGAERYLFANDETAFQTLRSARFIAIEIHDQFRIRPRIYNCLDKFGFDYFDDGELTIGRNKKLVK